MNENVKIHTYIHTDRRTDILRHTEGEGGGGTINIHEVTG